MLAENASIWRLNLAERQRVDKWAVQNQRSRARKDRTRFSNAGPEAPVELMEALWHILCKKGSDVTNVCFTHTMERNNEKRITYAGYSGCSSCNALFSGSAAILQRVASRAYAACSRGITPGLAPLSWETRLSRAITTEPPWLGCLHVDCVRSSFGRAPHALTSRKRNARKGWLRAFPHSLRRRGLRGAAAHLAKCEGASSATERRL